MSFTYSLDGTQVMVLTSESTVDWSGSSEVRAQVTAAAQRRANGTGQPVEVFAHDRASLLLQVKPE